MKSIVTGVGRSRHDALVRSIAQKLRTKVPLVNNGDDTSVLTTRKFLFDKSRRHDDDDDDQEQQQRLLVLFGENYLQLKSDLKERKRLYDIDTGAENKLSPKELSRRAAARAGLKLPEVKHFD
mmetsp:Transcript_10542/g.12084  ORF Transcript_10542/g.12084 Transcript_10542/m.12084 type:complete len:123 (+) Transcript_10542:191-559(+)